MAVNFIVKCLLSKGAAFFYAIRCKSCHKQTIFLPSLTVDLRDRENVYAEFFES